MINATPFHRRTAEINQANAWSARNGFTVSQFYSGADIEALSARGAAVLCDISFRRRLRLGGAAAEDFLSRLATQNIAELAIGHAVRAMWLGDDGALKGEGAIARLSRNNFVLETEGQTDWIEQAAVPFDISLARDEAGLSLIGPLSNAILAAAGLTEPDPLTVRAANWHGLDIRLSRLGPGTEIWGSAADAEILWDRFTEAGANLGLVPAGLAALDILELETAEPRALLVDEAHTGFNGRAAFLAAAAMETRNIVGVDIDAETPAPYALLMRHGVVVGRVLKPLYSPTLGRAIALAEIDKNFAASGTEFTFILPPDAENPLARNVSARAVTLPFLSV
jgi:aminomethyltransferase